jgi:hypothetical protein
MQYGAGVYEIGSRTAPGITVKDIAHSLAQLRRFTGHAKKPFSVARHSVGTCRLVRKWGHGINAQLYALVHDVEETVVQDLAYNVKQALPPEARAGYDAIAEAANHALYGVLDIPYPVPPGIKTIVKKADWVAVATERRDLMPPCPREWDTLPYEPDDEPVTPTICDVHDAELWLWEYVNLKFLLREPLIKDFLLEV